jgi:hypothetical protein
MAVCMDVQHSGDLLRSPTVTRASLTSCGGLTMSQESSPVYKCRITSSHSAFGLYSQEEAYSSQVGTLA